eukprot:758944-Hanusia_phi.AAC.2
MGAGEDAAGGFLVLRADEDEGEVLGCSEAGDRRARERKPFEHVLAQHVEEAVGAPVHLVHVPHLEDGGRDEVLSDAHQHVLLLQLMQARHPLLEGLELAQVALAVAERDGALLVPKHDLPPPARDGCDADLVDVEADGAEERGSEHSEQERGQVLAGHGRGSEGEGMTAGEGQGRKEQEAGAGEAGAGEEGIYLPSSRDTFSRSKNWNLLHWLNMPFPGSTRLPPAPPRLAPVPPLHLHAT